MSGLPDRVDVVVVGAGMSGLVAARDLTRAGLDVCVVEAADRPGGRAYGVTSGLGSRLDLGGQWVGAGHERLLALTDELGGTVYPMETPRVPRIVDCGRRVRPYSPAVLIGVASIAALELMSRTRVPHKWSGLTLDRLISRVPGARTRRLLSLVAGVSSTAELDKVTLGALATTVGVMGGAVGMLSSQGGAQESLIVEGAGHLVDRMADDLGARVVLGVRATAVRRGDEGVDVSTSAGRIAADHVVIAVPPPVAKRIAHHPPLPDGRTNAERSMRMGSVYKAVAVYPRPFWRKDGPAETLAMGDIGIGVFDSSAPGGAGHLTVLVGGSDARTFDDLGPQERRARILDVLGDLFGDDARTPADWHDKVWHLDAFVEGGYVAMPLPETVGADLPAYSTASGRVHWAGTETSDDHPGYLEGAICAGRRAAAEITDLRP
ncbi:monoamine oxidase [Gordonia malaquae]|uniref:Putative flavin-containing amine oxidase n=1 Tax=Gordonia malaquae NBRC 108250 TaxID=1223542 RepID=M3V9Y1_GORML|nr:NAD(P)/FAD-dependent oxidoreductase [Gordonia malaquae]GAC78353.1 putative flavin-containing amine oxidase [Gordonia malaquae NBRC 108250]SED32994.1 monoamine oxidase [Gordonia malaquae]